jgi:hypothetical protein
MRERADTRAIDTAWQWPKSGGRGQSEARSLAAIDKGRTPSYLSLIPAGNRKSAVL